MYNLGMRLDLEDYSVDEPEIQELFDSLTPLRPKRTYPKHRRSSAEESPEFVIQSKKKFLGHRIRHRLRLPERPRIFLERMFRVYPRANALTLHMLRDTIESMGVDITFTQVESFFSNRRRKEFRHQLLP